SAGCDPGREAGLRCRPRKHRDLSEAQTERAGRGRHQTTPRGYREKRRRSRMTPEVWLRGAVPDVPALLQPVAHALLQAREEVHALMQDFAAERLWDRPGGVASAGFHLQHLSGVLDRLFTYARSEQLNERQAQALAAEGKPDENVRVENL